MSGSSSWQDDDEDDLEGDDTGRALYSILNLSKDATTDEVKRAYRNAAQAFHPDKHTDPSLRDRAKESFAKLQEAYEVLSDPRRREVYDVYGRQGLAAGMEVGDHLKGHAELKKEWEEFRARRKAERQEQLTNHKGTYVCRIDASDLQRPGDGKGSAPLFKAVMVHNSVEVPIGDHDVVTIQGQAALRNQMGTGNVIFGYRSTPNADDSLEANVVLGQQTMLSASTTRRLSPHAQATLGTSWTWRDGMGLQIMTSRNLFPSITGQFGWVLGPTGASGMNVGITRRGDKHVLAGKLEVGAVTAISARLTMVATDSINVRVVARCGSTGVDLEVGASKRWSPHTSGYMGALVGLQGIIVKTRYTRGGQVFECPVVLTQQPGDWRVLVASYTLPPLLYWSTLRYVVRPAAAWQRRWKDRRSRAEFAGQISASLRAAVTEQDLVLPVARRKAAAEAARGGLVVLEAVYGSLQNYLAEPAAARHQPQQEAIASGADTAPSASAPAASGAASGAPAAGGATATPVADDAAAPLGGDASAGSAPQGETTTAAGHLAGQAGQASTSAAAPGSPIPWLFVTAALQYLVVDGRLLLHENGSKANLMGFADMAPGEAKQLYVAYWSNNAVYEVVLSDTQAAALASGPVPPAAGLAAAGAAVVTPLTDGERRHYLLSRAEAVFGLDWAAVEEAAAAAAAAAAL